MSARYSGRSKEAESYHRWYSTYRWQKVRAAQLNSQPLCERCKAKGLVVQAKVANHKIPHKGDEYLFWYGELESVCKPCHDGPIQSAERRKAKGLPERVVIGLDGWPID